MTVAEKKNVPRCIGVIVDGNRRWATAQGLPTFKGHEAGYKNFKEFLGWAQSVGIRHVIAYVFSTENWNRSPKEVTNLMNLLRFIFKEELKTFSEKGIRIEVAGQKERLDKDIQKTIEKTESETKNNEELQLVLALSYGGRAEIVAAAQKLIDEGVTTVTEELFSKALWTGRTPDPDMVIRTGAVTRLSNFLPWQSVYSELFFTDTLFPDFSKEEFTSMLSEYVARERRRGR